jgi:hypothetical protein
MQYQELSETDIEQAVNQFIELLRLPLRQLQPGEDPKPIFALMLRALDDPEGLKSDLIAHARLQVYRPPALLFIYGSQRPGGASRTVSNIWQLIFRSKRGYSWFTWMPWKRSFLKTPSSQNQQQPEQRSSFSRWWQCISALRHRMRRDGLALHYGSCYSVTRLAVSGHFSAKMRTILEHRILLY